MGAPASPSGSHPSGHAASGVDGASRFDPSRFAELADRYEASTKQDRELDAELGELIGFEVHRREPPFQTTCRRNPSVSLEDAECVVPVCFEWGVQRVRPDGYYAWLEDANDPLSGPFFDARAATVPLALTAAALRARRAIATEARRAETLQDGSAREGAGPKDIAQ